jgi:hypothetical protein
MTATRTLRAEGNVNDSESPERIEDVDAAIAEFHRAARKKKATVFGVASVFAIAIGVIVVLIGFSVEAPAAPYEIRAVFAGGILIVAGLGAAVSAYRLATGQVDDAELGQTTHHLQ